MSVAETIHTPAEIYDRMFVPALFRQWGPIVAEAADVGPGDRVLDVACGTGVLACAALEKVGMNGSVTGLDANPDMLTVARRNHPQIEWRDGRAEALPFADGTFDGVVSQFGLMFFDDRPQALREMMRVLRKGGRMAVAVCDALENAPGYAAFAGLLGRLFGDRIAEAFRAPFVLGEPDRLLSICSEAGIGDAEVSRRRGSVNFTSIDALVSTERACVWTLGGLLDDEQFAELRREAGRELKDIAGPDGTVSFDMPSLIVTATRH